MLHVIHCLFTWYLEAYSDSLTIHQLAQNKAALHLKLLNDEEYLKEKHCAQE